MYDVSFFYVGEFYIKSSKIDLHLMNQMVFNQSKIEKKIDGRNSKQQ